MLLLGDLTITFGGGVRRNVAKVSRDERNTLKEAFIALHTNQNFRYPGKRNDKPFVGGVSYWSKQDEIYVIL